MEFKLKRILPVLIGLIFLWIIFLLSRFLLETHENPNHNYVPANSSMVMRIDGKQFLESAAYDLAYKTGDEGVLRQLEALSASNKNRSKFRDAGIDFFSDVIVFTEPMGNTTVIGLLFNLSDEEKFKQVMAEILQKNQAFATNGEIGIFLIDPFHQISREKLSAHAEKLFVAGSKPAYIRQWTGKEGTFLNLELKDQVNPVIESASLKARLNTSLLEFTGNFQGNEQPAFSSVSLKPDGFHFSAAILSQKIQDSLRSMLAQKEFDFPDIVRVSVNYRGMDLDSYAPMADLLLEFESPIDQGEIYANNTGWKKLGFTTYDQPNGVLSSRSSTFAMKYGNTSYTIRIVDNHTIFIGQDLKNLQNVKSGHLFLFKGDIQKITHLEGGGFLGMGVNLYPPFRVSKEFLEAISTADVKIVPQKGKYVLDGKIQFRNNKYPVSETLKLILGLSN